MLKLIRTNKKFVLAGLMILSMLTFVVNRGNGNGGTGADDHEMGTIGGKTVYASEMVETRAELSALKNYLTFSDDERDGGSRFLQQLIAALGQKPELFFLLRHEALALGVQVSKDEVMTVMANHAGTLDQDTDIYDATYAGVTDLLKIIARFEQVSNAVKISKPMVDQALVQQHETIQANLVQFNAQDYLAKVPAPTTQEVADQFSKFSDLTPHHPNPTTNPFGFGYKLPLQAKVQYLRISGDAIGAAVVATKSSYDWEVAANKYYLRNSSEFVPKPATTAPTTMPAIAPPLLVVHDQVLQKIRQPMVTALMEQVQGFVSSTLNTDYQSYVKSIGSKETDSSLGVPYSSFTYLSKLIDKVHAKYNVTIAAGDSPDYLAEDQIASIPGVGSAALATFVTKEATNYLAQLDAKDPSAAALLLRPSVPLQGSEIANSVVIARLTAALPSQAPANLDQVRPMVTADCKIAAAYKLAQADAAIQLTAAKAGTLLVTAPATGHPVITLDADSALSLDSNDVKGVYPPLGDSAPSFMNQAFGLLNTYNPAQNPHPAETIELPEQRRLFVAQLTFMNVGWNSETYFRNVFEASLMAAREQRQILESSWFNYDAVVKRLDFQQPKSNKN